MTETKNIYQRIIDFQKSMPVIKKDETARVSGVSKSGKSYEMSYNYATLDSIQKAIQEPLANAGLGYTQEATNEGLKTTLFDVDGNTKEFMYPAVFAGKPQEIGSAMTYAKRYALTACLGLIIEGEDDDGNQAQNSKQEYPPKKTEWNATNTVWLTEQQYQTLLDLIETKQDLDKVKKAILKYSGSIINDVKYQMKKEWKDNLDNLIKNL